MSGGGCSHSHGNVATKSLVQVGAGCVQAKVALGRCARAKVAHPTRHFCDQTRGRCTRLDADRRSHPSVQRPAGPSVSTRSKTKQWAFSTLTRSAGQGYSAHPPAALAASSAASAVSSSACRRHARSRCAARSMLSAADGHGPRRCPLRWSWPPLPSAVLSSLRGAAVASLR